MQLGELITLAELSGLSDSTTTSLSAVITSALMASGTNPPSTSTVPPTFVDGLGAWKTPSAAFGMFTNLGTIYSVAGAPYVLGFLTVPIALAVGVYFITQKQGRG